MFSRRSDKVPEEVSKARMGKWYSSLSEQDKVKAGRYLKDADTSSPYSFLFSVTVSALKDDNYSFAASICEGSLANAATDMERFEATELLINAYIGMKRYDDAKLQCENGLELFPKVSEQVKKKNSGSVPEDIKCRNRYIDILIGIESGYDEAFALLERFHSMGMISSEDLAFRKQSLRIHRLQRSFDGVYTYTYKE